jgi:hypothetical protein
MSITRSKFVIVFLVASLAAILATFIGFLTGQANANECADIDFFPETTGQNVFKWIDSSYDGIQLVNSGRWVFNCAQADGSISERVVTIDALRFDPRSATLELGLTSKRVASLNASESDIFLTEDRDAFRKGANLATIAFYDSVRDQAEVAFINASWWLEADETAVAGLLKIDGDFISNTAVPDLSAVICLDDRDPANQDVDHQVVVVWNGYPTGYQAYDKWFSDKYVVQPDHDTPDKQYARWERIKNCPTYFQAGPRIVEYDSVRDFLLNDEVYKQDEKIKCLGAEPHPKSGVCDPDRRADLSAPKRRRVVLALDSRGPDLPRRIYLISTEEAISAYQIQKMLLRDDFYGDAKPHVAVNLASSDKSGLIIKDGDNGYFVSGSVDEIIPSYLAVKTRSSPTAADAAN